MGLSQHNRTISEHGRVWEAANRRRVEKLCLSAPLHSRPSFKSEGEKRKKDDAPVSPACDNPHEETGRVVFRAA